MTLSTALLTVLVAASGALIDCNDPPKTRNEAPPPLPVSTVINRCAGVRDLEVIDKRLSTPSVGSRVYWCEYGFLQGGVVFDDSACWMQARVGQRRPIACENAR